MLKDTLVKGYETTPGATIASSLSPSSKPGNMGTTEKGDIIPTFEGISGWDKTKNALGSLGRAFGINTHKIANEDYVYYDPKTGKDTN